MSVSRPFRCVLSAAAIFLLSAPEVHTQDNGMILGRVFLEGTREPRRRRHGAGYPSAMAA